MRPTFTFTGKEEWKATVVIRDQRVKVEDGRVGHANLRVRADSETWIRFLVKEVNLAWAMLRGKIRIGGPLKYLLAFAKRFPG